MGAKGKNVINRITKNGLDATQKIIASELAYRPYTGKTIEEIALENNVNRSTIWRWKSFPNFNEEVNRISNEIQKSHLVDVNSKLMEMVNSSNEKSVLKAIELYYKKLGLLKEVQETTINQETKLTLNDILKEVETL